MTDRSKVEHLVVYGTLLKEVGHPCHSILAEFSEFVAQATFQGILYDLGEYPGALIRPDRSEIIHGALYRLTDPQRALIKLDAYESHYPHNPSASLFRREAVEVFQSGAGTLTAWVYLYNRSVAGKPTIRSGSYLNFWRTRPPVHRA